jgi:hypothetical protein
MSSNSYRYLDQIKYLNVCMPKKIDYQGDLTPQQAQEFCEKVSCTRMAAFQTKKHLGASSFAEPALLSCSITFTMTSVLLQSILLQSQDRRLMEAHLRGLCLAHGPWWRWSQLDGLYFRSVFWLL